VPCGPPLSAAEEFGERRARIVRAHEGLADQEGVHAGTAHPLHVLAPQDAGFVTSSRSAGTSFSMPSVVSRLTSKLRRLRLLMPTSFVFSRSARCSSAASCTSTSTAMSSMRAMPSSSAICASDRQAAISRMQSAPITRAS
jgi:hypothetical protein